MQGGDKAALLAAINDAAANIGSSKKGGGPSAQQTQAAGSAMMKNSNVNQHVARDLVSNANSRVADMNDFAGGRTATKLTAEQFEHGKTLLNNRAGLDTESRQVEEDLRSLRSEFDYGSKKKFVDVLGNVSNQTKLNRLRAQHEIEKAGGVGAAGNSVRSGASLRSNMTGKLTQKSKMSRISMGLQNRTTGMQNPQAEAIPEVEGDNEELEAKPEDFVACNSCVKQLSEDEKIINARFVNEALAASRDISVFPVCIACNFENLEASNREARQREKQYAQMKQSKGVFFPSNKKLYDQSMHQNSEEFK